MSRPIRPNLHTPNKGTSGSIATAAAALQRRPKFVQRGDTVAHDLKLNNGEKCRDRFSISKEWAMKTTDFLCPKRSWPGLPTTTVVDTFCWIWFQISSVAKSAGSWVQEQIERDTAALNLHSFTECHWSIGAISQRASTGRPRNQNVSGLKWP